MSPPFWGVLDRSDWLQFKVSKRSSTIIPLISWKTYLMHNTELQIICSCLACLDTACLLSTSTSWTWWWSRRVGLTIHKGRDRLPYDLRGCEILCGQVTGKLNWISYIISSSYADDTELPFFHSWILIRFSLQKFTTLHLHLMTVYPFYLCMNSARKDLHKYKNKLLAWK